MDPGSITRLLHNWQGGNQDAFEELLGVVYAEMRLLAGRYLRRERSGHTMQATDLVHEAYMRLLGYEQTEFKDRSHFFAVAAQSMRRILVDHARRYQADKRADPRARISLEDAPELSEDANIGILAVHEALEQLEEVNERQAKVVELRYFGGLKNPEIAEAIGVSLATVERDWKVARVWLRRRLQSDGDSAS